MNRRAFLKSLAAIGVSLAIEPLSLAQASSTEIDTAWQALAEEPQIFYVEECGALSSWIEDYEISRTSRQSLFGLDSLPTDPDQLLPYIEANSRVESYVEYLFECAEENEIGGARDWYEWIASSKEVRDSVSDSLTDWLDGAPDEWDWEMADLGGYTGRGHALLFFQREFETAENLNIQIIEGDHPGSSYYAAELRGGIEETNALAEARGIPIRFEYGG